MFCVSNPIIYSMPYLYTKLLIWVSNIHQTKDPLTGWTVVWILCFFSVIQTFCVNKRGVNLIKFYCFFCFLYTQITLPSNSKMKYDKDITGTFSYHIIRHFDSLLWGSAHPSSPYCDASLTAAQLIRHFLPLSGSVRSCRTELSCRIVPLKLAPLSPGFS